VQTSARAVRRNASLALVSLAGTLRRPRTHEREDPALLRLLQAAMGDEDRYVRALGIEGLCRLGSRRENGDVLGHARAETLRKLVEARWCGLTNEASPF
jgi:hypothetical protein